MSEPLEPEEAWIKLRDAERAIRDRDIQQEAETTDEVVEHVTGRGGPDKKGSIMKKFLVLTYGYTTPTPEVQQAWGDWFAAAGPHLADQGSPFSRGVQLTSDARTELSLDTPRPLTGYCILNAADLTDAESIVASMPIIDGVRIYEADSM